MPRSSTSNGFGAARAVVLGLSRVLMTTVATAAPLTVTHHEHKVEEGGPGQVMLLSIAMALVLLGGAFAGLTIALMGQDSIYLQVLSGDPTEPQAANARRVHQLLGRGKHWVLVTLLLANVIVNETLPVILDRSLGGGVAAVIGSTVLIVIFGEVVPQSICVRYGLQIGGVMAGPVLVMMWLMAPIAWPTAKLLDFFLGADHPTIYKKSGLKTLVTLHSSLGDVSQRLNEDEVTIIRAVLDLKEKPVSEVMTPMDDVFVMSEDTVLDEKTMDRILSQGYSRIPIHVPGEPNNFVGMLLVKILITYDPEDCKLVRDFPLATLPETRPETCCLDIVNFFQEGKSHMVVVSESPGNDHGALGVVTLEDVIEELIGEEIIDESDVFVDVHKAIRRGAPAPKARISRRSTVEIDREVPVDENRLTTLDELRTSLARLGPSNPAANPKDTKLASVKIKTGHGPGAGTATAVIPIPADAASEIPALVIDEERAPLLQSPSSTPPRGKITGKGGVNAVRRHYAGGSSAQSRLAAVIQSSDPVEIPSNEEYRPYIGGALAESVIETGGVRKIVITAHSSSCSSTESLLIDTGESHRSAKKKRSRD